MFILNITCIVDDSLANEFAIWLINDYKGQIETADEIERVKIIKVLHSPNEGQTYGIQLYAATEESFAEFSKNHFPTLQKKMQIDHQGKLFIFDSLMQVIAS